jgi:hypothetical protein
MLESNCYLERKKKRRKKAVEPFFYFAKRETFHPPTRSLNLSRSHIPESGTLL